MQILARGFVRTAAAVAAVSVVAAAAGVSLSNGRPPVNQEASEPSTVPRADSRPGQTAQVDRTSLHRAIQLAADYLVRACGPNGKFVYLAYLDPSEVPTGAYNIVRHAGTIYALGMHHQWRPTDAVRDAMVRATGYLKQQAIAPVPGCEEFLAVWQCPDVDSLHKPIRTSLGACGLGLVALVSTEGAAPGTTGIEGLRRLGRFLVFLQQEDGCFYHSYIPSRGGVSDRGECLYYPGEAALGLLMLYELDPDPRWLETAAKALGWLARSREDEDSVPADHWALLATAKLMTRHEQCESIISRGQLLTHAVQICQSILEEQQVEHLRAHFEKFSLRGLAFCQPWTVELTNKSTNG